MRQRFKIAPAIIERFKDDICVIVDTYFTYIQEVEPQETFLDPLGYEISDDIVIGYSDLLLNSEKDQAKYRFGTYEEITQSTHQASIEKASHKKIETIMKKYLTKVGMKESESQVVRQTMKKDIMYVQPLSVSIAKTYLE